jgi:ATP-dependent RNA helicase DeaD
MLANSFLTDAESIVVDRPDKDLPPIEHLYCEVGGELMSKPLALCDLIETQRPSSAIIFCNTRSDTSLVESLLRRRGFDARRINSDLTQSQRNRVMKKIRDKELRFLVATDIAARGLDLDNIDLVINYAIHDQPETYIHRTGRTGRAGKTGRAISLIGPKDFGAFHFLQKVVEAKFQKISPPTDEEVAVARLAHLQEILRREHLDLRERDLLVARTLLNELGGITETSDEVAQFVAKLCCHAVEHYTTQEAKALDEELDAPPPAPPTRQEREERRDHRRSDQDRGDRRQGRRREGEERGHRDERRRSESPDTPQERLSEERGQDRNQNDRRESSSQSEPSRAEDDPRGRSRRPELERDSRRQDNPQRGGPQQRGGQQRRGRERGQSQAEDHELRVYIGQGQREGMTPQTFTDLALEFAEIPAEKLKRLSIRDRYGFVDLDTADAEKLIANLNGIQYNGALLPIERAAAFREERRRPPESKPRNPDDASTS